MSTIVTIREALFEDSETVSGLTRELFLELDHTQPIADLKQSAQFCKEIIEKDDYFVFLAVSSKGSAEGIITLSEGISIYAGGKFGVIREFYVVPEMRSRGIGKALWYKTKEFSRSKGWKRIEVTPPSKEKHMRTYSFYAKEGFREIGPRLKYEDSYG
jgi:GNAT superfamily N-acetyltransferase